MSPFYREHPHEVDWRCRMEWHRGRQEQEEIEIKKRSTLWKIIGNLSAENRQLRGELDFIKNRKAE